MSSVQALFYKKIQNNPNIINIKCLYYHQISENSDSLPTSRAFWPRDSSIHCLYLVIGYESIFVCFTTRLDAAMHRQALGSDFTPNPNSYRLGYWPTSSARWPPCRGFPQYRASWTRSMLPKSLRRRTCVGPSSAPTSQFMIPTREQQSRIDPPFANLTSGSI